MDFFQPKKARVREGRPNSYRRGYGGKSWANTRKRVLIRDSFQCRACGRVCGAPGEAHVDHIVPKKISGDDSEGNLQTLCAACHTKKTNLENKAPGFASKG